MQLVVLGVYVGLKKFVTYLGLALLLLVVTALVVVNVRPAATLNFAAEQFFNSEDLKITNIKGATIGLDRLSITAATVTTTAYKASFENIQVDYELSGLLAAKLSGVSAKKIIIEELVPPITLPVKTTDVSELTSFDEWLNLALNPPVENLDFPDITAAISSEVVSGRFRYSQFPPLLEGRFSAASLPSLNVTLESSLRPDEPLEVSITVSENARPLFLGQASIKSEEQLINITADADIQLQALIGLGQKFGLPTTLSSNTERLTLQTTLQLNLLESPSALTQLELLITSSNNLLSTTYQSNQDFAVLNTTLPISATVKGANSQGGITGALSKIEMSIQGQMEQLSFSSTVEIEPPVLTCEAIFQCESLLALKLQMQDINSPEWSAPSLRFRGDIATRIDPSFIRIAGEDSEVQLQGGVYGEVSSDLNAQLAQWEAILSDDQPLAAKAQFLLNPWQLSYGAIGLNQPQLSGQLSVDGNTLTGTITGSVQTDLNATAQFTTSLDASYGNISLQMDKLAISQSKPLTSYLIGTESEFELVAGTLTGEAQLVWRLNQGSLELSGPLKISADKVAGNYQDSLFVGLTTHLTANFTSPMGLESSGYQSVTIDLLELGLPIRDINWNYEFDSNDGALAVYQLGGNLLGGNISIPEAKFTELSSDTALTVVISDIDLNQVTALADYPELQVQGFVSGYLPIAVRNGTVIMEQGLVSALNPGGSIRYSPLSPSTNPSIKLVNDALSNYQFRSLDSELFYDEVGDLNMNVQLRGGNPDMQGGQAINLNLNIVNNIPDMLESLRASRSITDVLERNMPRRR